jgi:hypothetical protein
MKGVKSNALIINILSKAIFWVFVCDPLAAGRADAGKPYIMPSPLMSEVTGFPSPVVWALG